MTTEYPTISFDELLNAVKEDLNAAFREVDGRIYSDPSQLPSRLTLPYITVVIPNENGISSTEWVAGLTRQVDYTVAVGYFCHIPSGVDPHTWKRVILDKVMKFFCADPYYRGRFFFPKVLRAHVDSIKEATDAEAHDGIGIILTCHEEINAKIQNISE